MAQNQKISLEFFASGYCEAHAKAVNPQTGKGKDTFYAVWALIYVPQMGYVLFDTGYAPYFQAETAQFPEKFYRLMTPMFLKETETAKAILSEKGISASDIKYVIISHFHADHIAGLKDFPSAKFICSDKALEEVKALKGFRAVAKGIVQGLLPDDFFQRVITIEQFADKTRVSKEGITTYFLFQNKQFKLVALPGHARGMLGFVFETEDKNIFYGTDASWSYETYKQKIFPSKVVKLFFDSWKDFMETQEKIRQFEAQNPSFTILFTHCKKTLEYINKGNAHNRDRL